MKTLSESALALLRRRTSGERVPVTDGTRPAYRELAQAGIMVAGHSFTGGGTAFRVHGGGLELATATWPEESATPRP